MNAVKRTGETMANFKLLIQYDGTRYKGWQRQRTTDQTIQGKLEAILTRQFGIVIEVDGSGRTDAGVHARGQVANTRIPRRLLEEKWGDADYCALLQQMFAEFLPEDIAVISVREASDRFHARLNAVGKTYVYRIWNEPWPNVFERRYMLHRTESFDPEAMRQAAALLEGQHDFAAFCGNARMKKSTVRRIDAIRIERIGGELRLTFSGNGFLQNMVRILAGTLLAAGRGSFPPEHITEILESRTRAEAGEMLPAQGLTLVEVRYD